jgi:SAM-dependent methyltransferase
MARKRSHYIHGTAAEEQRRLSKLNDILNAGYIDAVDPRPGDRILDLGSGLGQFTRLMAERASRTPRRAGRRASPHARAARPQVIGIERDPRQLAAAKQLLRSSPFRKCVAFRRADVTRLGLSPAERGSFDLVHTRFLLEHLPDPASVVRLMMEAARPGGRVFISDDDHDVFRLTPEPAGFRRLWRAYVRSYGLLGNDPFIGRKLVALLHGAGLERIRNGGLFFGGSAGDDRFEAIADNLIGIMEGAGRTILAHRLLGAKEYRAAMAALRAWRSHPAAAQWYVLFWAEGFRPGKS